MTELTPHSQEKSMVQVALRSAISPFSEHTVFDLPTNSTDYYHLVTDVVKMRNIEMMSQKLPGMTPQLRGATEKKIMHHLDALGDKDQLTTMYLKAELWITRALLHNDIHAIEEIQGIPKSLSLDQYTFNNPDPEIAFVAEQLAHDQAEHFTETTLRHLMQESIMAGNMPMAEAIMDIYPTDNAMQRAYDESRTALAIKTHNTDVLRTLLLSFQELSQTSASPDTSRDIPLYDIQLALATDSLLRNNIDQALTYIYTENLTYYFSRLHLLTQASIETNDQIAQKLIEYIVDTLSKTPIDHTASPEESGNNIAVIDNPATHKLSPTQAAEILVKLGLLLSTRPQYVREVDMLLYGISGKDSLGILSILPETDDSTLYTDTLKILDRLEGNTTAQAYLNTIVENQPDLHTLLTHTMTHILSEKEKWMSDQVIEHLEHTRSSRHPAVLQHEAYDLLRNKIRNSNWYTHWADYAAIMGNYDTIAMRDFVANHAQDTDKDYVRVGRIVLSSPLIVSSREADLIVEAAKIAIQRRDMTTIGQILADKRITPPYAYEIIMELHKALMS